MTRKRNTQSSKRSCYLELYQQRTQNEAFVERIFYLHKFLELRVDTLHASTARGFCKFKVCWIQFPCFPFFYLCILLYPESNHERCTPWVIFDFISCLIPKKNLFFSLSHSKCDKTRFQSPSAPRNITLFFLLLSLNESWKLHGNVYDFIPSLTPQFLTPFTYPLSNCLTPCIVPLPNAIHLPSTLQKCSSFL